MTVAREPQRILFIRLSALGDVLLATPAVRALKRRFPDARLDWLVEQPYLPLVAGNPHARAVAYDKRGRHAGAVGLRRLRDELRANGYDLVIDLQGKPKTWYLRGAGARSYAWRKRGFGEAALALLGRDRPLIRAHAVQLFLEAVAPFGITPDAQGLELVLTPEMEQEAAHALPAGERVGIAPGTRWETKRWPAERFAEVARALMDRGLEPLLLGGPQDAAALAALRAALPAGASLKDTAALSVGGLCAAIARCRLVVAGDSGPVHIASALGVPVVALFGPTSPNRWRPLSARSAVVRVPLDCSPCSNHGSHRCPLGHHDCMSQLEVASVLAAADRLLAGAGGQRGAAGQ